MMAGDEVRKGSVHKAQPCDRPYHCGACGQVIKSVPGGSGAVWVHADSGAVAAPNPPAEGLGPVIEKCPVCKNIKHEKSVWYCQG